ncbi:c-type cytochrome biogenesis protein CcsB [Thermodesulfobacteriota bacterium]
MNNAVILNYITFIYFFSFLAYLLMMCIGKEIFGKIASIITVAGFAGHSAALILRWIESYRLGIGHAPLSNLYESLIFFSWSIILLYLLVEWRTRNKTIGTFVTPLAFLAMAYSSFSEDAIQPLVPALKSNWLTAHVITCFFGYAAFALSFGLSLMYLFKTMLRVSLENTFFNLIPDPDILEELSYQMVVIGFLMLTLGIITGSVWANSAWGTYWSWDPKETWSLITWFVYAAMLHSRLVSGWRGKKLAVFSIVGFLCVIFTYLGVNLLLSGLHSYA